MNEIKPPTPPIKPQSTDSLAPLPIEETPLRPSLLSSKAKKRSLLWWMVGVAAVVLIAVPSAAAIWYFQQLQPVNRNDTSRRQVTIQVGSSPTMIAEQLADAQVVRSARAFELYVRFHGIENSLQAGTYHLSSADSTPEIATHLTNGLVDTFRITFLPGATLRDHKQVLLDAGYSETEIDEAFTATYEGDLFAGRPAGSDIEGYIYGETYEVNSDDSVQEILQRTFDELDGVVRDEALVEGFSKHGLSLYEGLTLASIIQRESIGGEEAQIAQVFYKRLAEDMVLGSDVTYQYIADKTGVERDVDLDSPYNTRRYPGLPPGPIASPGLAALRAVAAPADGDYLYFLSGDDDVTYFARTIEEHESNIQEHCKIKCQII